MTRPWPGNPDSAWAAVEEQAKTQRLSDRPASVPRMDDLGARLRRMSGLTNRVFGVALLIGSAPVPATRMGACRVGGWARDAVRGASVPVAATEAPVGCRGRDHPPRRGGIDGDHVRIGGEQAVRIVRACEQWATQLENDPTAYTEFWRRWRREDPEVLPTELLFGPDGVGGFVTCVDRHHRWFLVIPHRRKARPENPWHHAHAPRVVDDRARRLDGDRPGLDETRIMTTNRSSGSPGSGCSSRALCSASGSSSAGTDLAPGRRG